MILLQMIVIPLAIGGVRMASASRGQAWTASSLRPGSKQALLVEQVGSASGAALSDLVALLGWQPHTVRAALTGLRRRGFAVTRTRNESGATVYQVAARASWRASAGSHGLIR